MRFHVAALPHTHITSEYATCAYTEKVRKFCRMMMDRGHTVYLYAGEKNEAPCTEHIVCIGEAERVAALGNKHFTTASFDSNAPHWRMFNARTVAGIRERAQPRDFICLIGGVAQKPIADAFPAMMAVEFGVGYGGTFANYRVWESYAWMHHCYGYDNARAGRGSHDADGKWFDAVIPGYLEPEQFPIVGRAKPVTKKPAAKPTRAKNTAKKPAQVSERSDYLLYVGRMIERKGLAVAIQTAQASGRPLIMAGPGTPPSDKNVHYVGEVGPVERAKLMGEAYALIAPTIYIEPFGNVVVEAQACGTPTITTDWGAFTETNVNGLTGFRCRTLREFVAAVKACDTLSPEIIAQRARDLYSLDVIGLQYEQYFERLNLLWAKGWPELE